ncbi:MAG: hypothetical protein BGO55_10850 [Sphingobacteriales bacterium 50-39]|nr:hypothetical protein [Sphingobacteriales bacterium]OJW54203.1 MAG: hypothetical protein BGO55_10850 [Sphingobacteriales bacterium 50-39]
MNVLFCKKVASLSLVMVVLLTSCYKYKERPQVSNPAYIRVFNSLPYTVDALHAGQAAPFLCFLMDPVNDAAGVPDNGAVVGDWLHTRELFSLSYAADAGTALNAQSTIDQINSGLPAQDVINANYEYPGKLHVLTAPAMNGIDMSAWAQAPSGKHRLIFVTRPQDDRPFDQLPVSLRRNVIIDTTVDLQAGEVYTINALATDIDKSQYGVDVRHEQFVHEKFDPGRIYAAFYNLSSVRPYLATDPHFPYYWYYSDTLTISYTCWINDNNYTNSYSLNSWPLPGASDIFLSTIYRGKNDGVVFAPLPFLTRDYFFDQQGVLRTLTTAGSNGNIGGGTMPYFSFQFSDADPRRITYGKFPTLLCSMDPASFNTLDPNTNTSGATPLQGPQSKIYQPNLFRVIQSGGSVNIYPTVNVFEVINDRIYLLQLQRDFVKVPQ